MKKGNQLQQSQEECDRYFQNLQKTGRPENYKLDTFILKRDGEKHPMIYSCTGCIWLENNSYCPWVRCVKRQGWKADES